MGAGSGEVCHETMGDDGVGPVHGAAEGDLTVPWRKCHRTGSWRWC